MWSVWNVYVLALAGWDVWVRGLDLGFTNPVGTAECGTCVCVWCWGCVCGVGECVWCWGVRGWPGSWYGSVGCCLSVCVVSLDAL